MLPSGVRPGRPSGTDTKAWLHLNGGTIHAHVYKHAWDLANSMNSRSPEPLVTTSSGGRGGGGTSLTEAGETAVRLFLDLQKKMEEFLVQETRLLKNVLGERE